MKAEQAVADVELRFKDKSIKVRALVDMGAGRSVIPRKLADELKAFIH